MHIVAEVNFKCYLWIIDVECKPLLIHRDSVVYLFFKTFWGPPRIRMHSVFNVISVMSLDIVLLDFTCTDKEVFPLKACDTLKHSASGLLSQAAARAGSVMWSRSASLAPSCDPGQLVWLRHVIQVSYSGSVMSSRSANLALLCDPGQLVWLLYVIQIS